jgi:hypothetical protein
MQKRLPSVKTLQEVFGGNAKAARKILEMTFAELADTLHGAARIAECYHTPATSDIRMHVLDSLGGSFGVEAFETKKGWCKYLNTGDTYALTLVYFQGKYQVASWGDIAERMAT